MNMDYINDVHELVGGTTHTTPPMTADEIMALAETIEKKIDELWEIPLWRVFRYFKAKREIEKLLRVLRYETNRRCSVE